MYPQLLKVRLVWYFESGRRTTRCWGGELSGSSVVYDRGAGVQLQLCSAVSIPGGGGGVTHLTVHQTVGRELWQLCCLGRGRSQKVGYR